MDPRDEPEDDGRGALKIHLRGPKTILYLKYFDDSSIEALSFERFCTVYSVKILISTVECEISAVQAGGIILYVYI